MRSFGRDEDGSMIIFAMFIFLVMLMVGGMAVDLMRFETNRSRLQATLDRAVLASASLNQQLDPETVVRDYLDKAGLLENLTYINVTEALNSRTVTARAEMQMDTYFMKMLQVPQLTAPASSVAREAVTNIEVSLVLDISGSMRYNQRLINLQPAARNFVSDVLGASTSDTVSINLIPYAGSTNPGPLMFSYLNGVRYPTAILDDKGNSDPSDDIMFPNGSSCIEIPRSAFNSTGLPPANAAQVPHFMNWTIAASVMDWGWCPTDATSIIYASSDEAALHTAINNIRMHDGTGTHYAMRWGLALLNPTSRPAFEYLNANGAVSASFVNRPLDWDSPETAKYIVLMTDGQITEQTRPVDQLHPQNPTIELRRRASNQRYNITSANQNVTDFYKSCDFAKANGIIVYTIAFHAPAAAQTQMINCASSPTHFYSVTGAQGISDAFRAIATQINDLRLIQ